MACMDEKGNENINHHYRTVLTRHEYVEDSPVQYSTVDDSEDE